MRIMPVTQNSYQPKFKSNANWVYDKYGKELYKTTTYFFRDDLDWENLIKFLCQKYRDVPKINFINHACSNGMEPLSFLMSLMIYAPEQIEKFTPIIAKDIYQENINAAKNGLCGASVDDFLRTHSITKGRLKEFLSINPAKNTRDLFYLSPNDILKDKIIFEQGDILKDVRKTMSDNTVLCCRNMWMYLKPHEKEQLAYYLAKNLGKNSTVILGFLDNYEGCAGKLLEKNGLKRCLTGSEYVNIMYSN